MTSSKSDNKHWEDPKDFGLPYVEIIPLASLEKKIEKEDFGQQQEKIIESSPALELKAIGALEDQMPRSLGSSPAVSPLLSSGEKQENPDSKINIPKKNQTWIWLSAIIAVILLVIIYSQIQKIALVDKKTTLQNPIEINSKPIVPAVKDQMDTITNEKTAIEQNISDSVDINRPINQEIQSNNALSLNNKGRVERISNRLENPRYFIVVASLGNESMARVEADKYLSRGEIIYLILPHENALNYRLSIGFFDSFKDANNELERIKSKYLETLWILKY